MTDCIVEQIKTFLEMLISNNQTGFVKGRLIGKNITLAYDIMNYNESKQIPDFEKAFDLVSLKLIFLKL